MLDRVVIKKTGGWRGSIGHEAGHWHQEENQVPAWQVRFLTDILGFIVSIPLLLRLEIVIVKLNSAVPLVNLSLR